MRRDVLLCVALIGMSGVCGAQKPAERFSSNPVAEKIENLDLLKKELRDYHACTCTCGCYQTDMDAQAEKAIAFLRQRVAHRKAGEKPAVVLDIDETSLSNYEEMQKADFAYNSEAFNAWEESAQAPAIPGTLRLVKEAKQLGVAVIFLTGRGEKERATTERNLRAQGFDGWEKLILRSVEEKDLSAEIYKSAERARLLAAGYTLILSMGDQWSDLKGAPEAEFSVKYPNPYYFLK